MTLPTDQSPDVPDFLFFMRNDYDPTTNGGKVRINFHHKFALLNIIVNLGSAQETNPISNVRLGGIITEAKAVPTKFDANGIPLLEAADNGNWALITPKESFTANSQTVTYECSVIPQTVGTGNLFVTFTMNGRDYTWYSTKAMNFTEGKRNTITITIE